MYSLGAARIMLIISTYGLINLSAFFGLISWGQYTKCVMSIPHLK
jgi:hypothetical protein